MRALSGLSSKINSLLPNGVLDAGLQFFLFLLAYQGYQVVRGLTDSGAIDAYVNAYDVIDLERSLGLFFEPGFQQALLEHTPWLIDFANFMYLNSHFVITTGFLAWLYLRPQRALLLRPQHVHGRDGPRPGRLRALPDGAAAAVPGPGLHRHDRRLHRVGPGLADREPALNKYAAIPSMHIAFSLMIAVPAANLVRHRLPRLLWFGVPADRSSS